MKWEREREREREGELMTMAVCCPENNELPPLFEHCFSILTLICESYPTFILQWHYYVFQ